MIKKLKIFRALGDKFRLNMDKYNTVFSTVCGQVRLELGTLIIQVLNCVDNENEIEVNLDHLWSSFLTVNP